MIDGVRPTFSAYAADAGTKTITITASEIVSGTPDATDFTVTAGGSANTVTAAAVATSNNKSTITLTVANMIQNSAVVTVTYDASSSDSKKIKDANGNAVVDVTVGQSVTVTNDVSAPTVASVSSDNADGTDGIVSDIPI